MNTLCYKGYTARIDFDDRDNILVLAGYLVFKILLVSTLTI